MRRRDIAQVLLLGVGIAILFWTCRSIDWGELQSQASGAEPASFLVFLIYPFVTVFDVRGWQIVLPAQAQGARAFRELYLIRMAGEAFNGITPFVDVGGEYLKTVLTASRLNISETTAFASVILTRTGMFYSELWYWACGLAVIGAASVTPEWRMFFLAVAGIFLGIAFVVALLQKKGLLQIFLAPLRRLGIGGSLAERAHDSARQVDAEIAVFYESKKLLFFRSVVWHFLGWVGGGIETWAMFRVVGAPVSLGEGLAIEALFQLLKTGSFFIPGNLGVQEAGFGFFAEAAGFPAALGVGVSFLKRIRQWLWTGIGFGIWAAYGRRKRKQETSPA